MFRQLLKEKYIIIEKNNEENKLYRKELNKLRVKVEAIEMLAISMNESLTKAMKIKLPYCHLK